MILVDTTIWIEFFRGRQPAFAVLTGLLETRQAWAPECVFAELLQGAKGEGDRAAIHGMWETLPRLESAETLIAAGEASGRHRWSDKGIGLIDAWIITIARLTDSRIWSLDKKLNSALIAAKTFEP